MAQRILFVDDDQHMLDGFRRALRHYEDVWEMTFTTSVDDAVEHLRKSEFDVVVSDMMMPGKNGFDLLALMSRLKKCHAIPVVMVTGDNDTSLKRRALELGATDLLNKPVDVEELSARLWSALRLKSAQDAVKAHNASLEQAVLMRTKALEAAHQDLIFCLGRASEYRDEETGNHIIRVGHYCRTIAETLDMDREFMNTIFLTSPLHDIGKIGIPDAILLKPGKLTSEERAIMNRHCAIGADLLCQGTWMTRQEHRSGPVASTSGPASGNNPLLRMASAIALGHHERWDGTGYPAGLAGESIPLEARIVALADVYDALLSVRPYKPAFPEDETLTFIRGQVGRHFDPAVFVAFERSIEAFREIRTHFSDTPDHVTEPSRKHEKNPVC